MSQSRSSSRRGRKKVRPRASKRQNESVEEKQQRWLKDAQAKASKQENESVDEKQQRRRSENEAQATKRKRKIRQTQIMLNASQVFMSAIK